MLGGEGNDALYDSSSESNAYNAGAGDDSIFGGVANELFIGGTGNDTIDVQTGADILVFNKGDGQDQVTAFGSGNTVSLGHGIVYADLALRKLGNTLVLKIGATDQITFKNWYETGRANVSTLQVVTEGGADYVPGSSSAINDNKVELFDFLGLVTLFNQARAANPSLSSWSMGASMAAYSAAGSDTAAIGGDLAYRYAVDGGLAALGMNAGLAIIGSPTFGNGMQTLLNGGALVDGSPIVY